MNLEEALKVKPGDVLQSNIATHGPYGLTKSKEYTVQGRSKVIINPREGSPFLDDIRELREGERLKNVLFDITDDYGTRKNICYVNFESLNK